MKNAKVLHCLAALDDGLSSHVCKQLIARLGPKLDHTIVTISGRDNPPRHQLQASILAEFPQIDGIPTPARLLKLAQAMAPYDLVLTHDYDALNMAMAHTAFSQAFGLPPLIHHEFGFGTACKRELTTRRNWYRRIALGRSAALVVPSEKLEGLALMTWQQPIGRVKHIAPGIDVSSKPRKVAQDALRGLIKREGEKWIGTIGDAAKPGDWQQVLSALNDMPENWQLIVAGDGEHLSIVRQQAERMELSHRVHLPGKVADEAKLLGLLDIYLDIEGGEAFPRKSLNAMGTGLPVAGICMGELSQLVCEGNVPFVVEAGQREELHDALISLAEDDLLRKRLGEQNRIRAERDFPEPTMVGSFKRLYASALGREL
jgi:glycosyltransferase involved in cell wall biosynthesis